MFLFLIVYICYRDLKKWWGEINEVFFLVINKYIIGGFKLF